MHICAPLGGIQEHENQDTRDRKYDMHLGRRAFAALCVCSNRLELANTPALGSLRLVLLALDSILPTDARAEIAHFSP